jgi:hypothetical protein
MHPKYKYRHRLLGYLYNKLDHDQLENVEITKSRTRFREVAEALKIDPFLLKEYHHALHINSIDQHVKCEGGEEYWIRLTEAGVFAYTDDYWLREGEKERNERIYDKIKWKLPIISLILSIIATVVSVVSIWFRTQPQ